MVHWLENGISEKRASIVQYGPAIDALIGCFAFTVDELSEQIVAQRAAEARRKAKQIDSLNLMAINRTLDPMQTESRRLTDQLPTQRSMWTALRKAHFIRFCVCRVLFIFLLRPQTYKLSVCLFGRNEQPNYRDSIKRIQ